MDCIKNILPLFQILGLIATCIGIFIAAYTFYENSKIKRGEWLTKLFEKFYENKTFGDIRRELDYGRIESYLELNNISNAENEKHQEDFINFLNFFELISVLVKKDILDNADIKDMFEYYIKSIAKNDFIKKEFITKYGFENFENLLKKYE